VLYTSGVFGHWEKSYLNTRKKWYFYVWIKISFLQANQKTRRKYVWLIRELVVKRIAMHECFIVFQFCLYNKQKNTWVLGNTRFISTLIEIINLVFPRTHDHVLFSIYYLSWNKTRKYNIVCINICTNTEAKLYIHLKWDDFLWFLYSHSAMSQLLCATIYVALCVDFWPSVIFIKLARIVALKSIVHVTDRFISFLIKWLHGIPS
jgi:hypothetical protein